MELRNVKTFLKAAELDNFAKVAQELGYAPSTVSTQIQQLEEELGFPLFNRINRKVNLTTKGLEFLPYAEEIVKTIKQVQLLKDKQREVQGYLHFGVVESLFSSVILPLLPEFTKQYPKVKILFKSATTADLLESLKQGDQDLIFGIGKRIVDKECRCIYANPERLVFVASPDNELTGHEVVPLNTVLTQPMIMPERDSIYRRVLEETAADKGHLIDPLFTIDNSNFIIRLVQRGVGISFLPEYVVHDRVIKGSIAIINVQESLPQFWSQLFYHKRKWVSPPMEAMINIICRRW